jgi:hypothetical protein
MRGVIELAGRASVLAAGLCVLLAGSPAVAQVAAPSQKSAVHSFHGTVPGKTPDFQVQGPWTLQWSAVSDFPLMANLELDLYNVETGRFVGLVVQHAGNGSGEQIIREGGRYELVASGQAVKWSVKIGEASQDVADYVKQHPDATVVQLVAPDFGLTPALVHSITGWQASADDKSLLLTLKDGSAVRTTFFGDAACPGLKSSEHIFFVTSGIQGNKFNAIMLENGKRCYLSGYKPAE